jgi:hypothetical protein
MDQKWKDEVLRLAMDMAGPGVEATAESVVDASRTFYRKRYRDRFK